jgi:Flp pilus assembly protein TadG
MVREQRTRCRGVSTVEFALVLPLLLVLTLGAIRYGHLFLKAQQITNAARHGARTAVRSDASVDAVLAEVDGLMTAANMGASGYSVTLTPTDVAAPGMGESVTVQITVPCANIDVLHVPLFTDLEPENWNLGAKVTMAKESF